MRMTLVVIVLLALPLSAAEDVMFFSFSRDSFSATGKWVPSDPKQKPAFPSETQIDCSREGMSCADATAEYYVGYPHVSINYLRVIRWDADGIIARDSSGICMTVTMQIVFA